MSGENVEVTWEEILCLAEEIREAQDHHVVKVDFPSQEHFKATERLLVSIDYDV